MGFFGSYSCGGIVKLLRGLSSNSLVFYVADNSSLSVLSLRAYKRPECLSFLRE